MPNRACVFVIYDKDGIVDESVHYYLRSLVKLVSRMVIVANGFLTEKSIEQLKEYTSEIIVRSNEGYDVAAFKEGILTIGFEKLKEYDELIVANDSVFGPVYPLEEMFDKMGQKTDLSFWGISAHRKMKNRKLKNNPTGIMQAHVQSYFTVYNSKLLKDTCFEEYWTGLPLMKNRDEVIERNETYVTYFFEQKGHKWDSYVPMIEKADEEDILHSQPVLALSEYRCPIVKKRIFIPDPYFRSGLRDAAISYLEESTLYPTCLIEEYAKKHFNIHNTMLALDCISALENSSLEKDVSKKQYYWIRIKDLLKHFFLIWFIWKIIKEVKHLFSGIKKK